MKDLLLNRNYLHYNIWLLQFLVQLYYVTNCILCYHILSWIYRSFKRCVVINTNCDWKCQKYNFSIDLLTYYLSKHSLDDHEPFLTQVGLMRFKSLNAIIDKL